MSKARPKTLRLLLRRPFKRRNRNPHRAELLTKQAPISPRSKPASRASDKVWASSFSKHKTV